MTKRAHHLGLVSFISVASIGSIALVACSGTDTSIPPAFDSGTPPATDSGTLKTDGGTSFVDSGTSNGCPTGGNACDQCIAQKCCTQALGCLNDPQCKMIDDCAVKCEDTSTSEDQYSKCIDACFAQYPQGAAKAEAVEQCVSANCAAPCSG